MGLAGFVAASAALLNPLPLLVGLVAEAAYLLFVPDSKWYESRMKAKFDEEVRARLRELKNQVFPQVHPDIRERFVRLESARDQIGQQSRSEEKWFREALRKLDFLMEKYLHFALKEAQFMRYLVSLIDEVYDQLTREEKSALDQISERETRKQKNPGDLFIPKPSEDWSSTVAKVLASFYDREIGEIQDRVNGEQVVATKAILEKRVQVLGRRREFVDRIGQILTNLRHQMELMSDAFGLINDEIRARSPEQVLADIDEVVIQTNSLTEAIEAVTPMEELVGTIG